MSNGSFRKFRCWRPAHVYETVVGDIGALRTQDDAVFLAAHAPVPIQQLWGPKARGDGEAQILNALRDQIGLAGRNTLIAVTGDVGTGKSHAVRWVRAHLDDDPLRYRTIYVPRDLSTLRSLLGRILGGLPGEKARQAERQLNDAIAGKSDSQLRDELIDNLRQVLNYELPDQGPGDQDADDREERAFLLGQREDRSARRSDGLGDILLNLRVIQHLSRDGGAVASVIQSIQASRGGRDESYPKFTPDDIPTNSTGIANRLDPDARQVWELVRTQPKHAVALLDEALQRAVSMTLGFGTGGLTLNEVFNDTRKLLRQEGTDLVLLFEDLALFGLVDDDLYDQFSQAPLDDYCPLRVVFAITTAKYLEMRDTVRDRVTHRYDIQNIESGNGDADPAMVTFVARYLNNARVGRDALIAARVAADERTRENGTWIPNACDIREQGQPCRHRDECFGAFGSVDTGPGGQVGLYPHNVVSLRRAFRHLRDENRLSPRSLVNEVVQSFLVTAEPEIGAGVFPTEEIGNWFFLGVNRAREAIVGEDELSSPEARERLRRARIVWANGEPEDPGIHLAFDLPGKVTDAGNPPAPEPTPRPPGLPSSTPERATDRVQFLYDWESNVTRLPVREMESFRTAFHDWTIARLDLGRQLVNVGSGMMQLILRRIFPETTFVIDFASGAEPAPGRLRFDVPQSSLGLRLLLAARWFADHGHWDPAEHDRQWDFPENFQPADLQVELENFLSGCAAAVEDRFVQAITSARGARPAAAVVALRAAALRVLGQLGRDDMAQVVAAVAQDRDDITNSWSPTWAELARPAREIIRSLDEGLIADFAAARQGDTGEPIVVDAAALEPAGHEAIDDPAAVAAGLGQFSDVFSEIERARTGLAVNWAGAVASERQELLVGLQFLRASVRSSDRDIVTWAEELGTRANDDRVFRPAGTYLRFRQEIEAMKSASREVVDGWIASEAAIRDPDNPTAIFDAQSWAAQARSYAAALQFVLEAMEATAQLLQERTAQRAGGDPAELAERVAARLEEAASLLDRLGRREPS
jgi:hypothetical protein